MPSKSSQEADWVRVCHILEAIKEVRGFLKGKTKKDLKSNRLLTLAVIKEIEMIGEAASKMSSSVRNRYTNIPWEQMIATRNRLIHGYFSVNTDIVWQTAMVDLKEVFRHFREVEKDLKSK